MTQVNHDEMASRIDAAGETLGAEKVKVIDPVEQQKQNSAKAAKDRGGDSADFRDMFSLLLASQKQVMQAMEWINKSLEGVETEKLFKDNPSDLRIRIAESVESPVRNRNTDFNNSAVMRQEASGAVFRDSSLDERIRTRAAYGANKVGELTGKDAENVFTARMRGYQKIFLLGSGFSVTIRPPTIEELNRFIINADADGREIGSILGGHYFYISDNYIKAKFMEFFPLLIKDCNLVDWEKGNNFANSVSIHDYETLIWAVTRTMYMKGYSLPHICIKEECKHERDVLYDIGKLRQVNTSMLGDKAYEMLLGQTVTVEQANIYRNTLIGGNRQFKVEDYTFYTKVPSVQEVIDYNNKIIARLVANTQGERTITSNKVVHQLTILFANTFAPWIRKMAHEAEDIPRIETEDINAIYSVIAQFQDTDAFDEIKEALSNLPKDTRVSFIGYLNEACVACGAKDEEAGSFKTWDPSTAFFMLSGIKIAKRIK
jgi:hypothetical protein